MVPLVHGRDRSHAGDIILGLVALLVVLAVVGQPSLHAVQKHGVAAQAAYTDTNHGTPRWRCSDGRVRSVSFVDKDTWAICVDTPAGMNITCFYTYSSAYVLDVITRCLGPKYLREHPTEAVRLGL